MRGLTARDAPAKVTSDWDAKPVAREDAMRARSGILTLVCVAVLWFAGASNAGDDSKSFWNGKDLGGWDGLTEYWSVKDSALVGSTAPKGLKFNTFLCSKKKYKDFEIQFEVRLKDGAGNSGLQIRSKLHDPKTFAVWGPQCDMADGYWGSLFGEHFGPGGAHFMMKAAPKDVVAKAMPKKGEFVNYYIKCAGKHVTIKLNDMTTVDDDFADLPEEGIIAFQLHSGGAMEVTFRNIQFKDLTKK
jgi:hypothetical protein